MSLFKWSGWREPMAKKKRKCEHCGERVWDERAAYCPTCLEPLPEESNGAGIYTSTVGSD